MNTKHPNQGGGDADHELSPREREVLRLVVKSFIDTAGPIGSRFLVKRFPIRLSPASIRNTMSDLEELGYLDHPYTSAGRIPTDLGYRKFVDELMDASELSTIEKQLIKAEIDRLVGDPEDMLREGSRMLGRLSKLLGVVLTPRLSTGVLDRLEIVPLSSARLMFVISMRGGLVKTIVAELDANLRRDTLDRIVRDLNERMVGHTLEEIRRTYVSRIRDIEDENTGVVRLILNEAPQLFNEPSESRRLSYGGTHNILNQPEFQEANDLKRIIKLMEDENDIVQLLEERAYAEGNLVGRAVITIGSENADEKAEKCSVVTARYQLGDTVGTIGVIGPTRMDYARVVGLVENMAAMLSRPAESNQENNS